MSPTSTRSCLPSVGVLVAAGLFLAGCAGGLRPPPVPPTAAQTAPPTAAARAANEDPYDGWLYKKMTGKGAAVQTPAPAAPGYPAASAPGVSPAASAPASSPYPASAPTAVYPRSANPTAVAPPANADNTPGPAAAPYLVMPAGGSPPPGGAPYAGAALGAAPSSGVVPVGANEVGPAGPELVPPGAITPSAPPTTAVSSSAAPGTPIVAAPSPTEVKKDDDDGFDWSSLSPENMWKGVKKASGYGPDEKIARDEFQAAESLFREKKYADAAKRFYTASWRWPDSVMEEDSMFLLGECYFFDDLYSKAHDAYTNLLKKHDNTRYLDTVMAREFAIGRYWEQMDTKRSHWPVTPNLTDKTRPWFDTFGNSLAAYESVRLHDPTGPYADYSVMATANAYFRKQRWEEAAYHYNLIRKDYPKSQFQKEAHVLGLYATSRMYQGDLYDGKPLEEASEIAGQTMTQFRGRLGEEETHVAEMRGRIVEQKAARELAMAEFYAKKKYFGSARQYYKSVIENYPQSRPAEYARKRLEEFKSEPDVPPQRFAWLTRLLDRER